MSETIDFVAKGERPDEWRLVLVEEGPWHAENFADDLRRIQNRLLNCVEVALGEELYRKFPEASGRRIVVELDCYDVPNESELREFFEKFSDGVMNFEPYSKALHNSRHAAGVAFAIRVERTN